MALKSITALSTLAAWMTFPSCTSEVESNAYPQQEKTDPLPSTLWSIRIKEMLIWVAGGGDNSESLDLCDR